MLLLPWLSPEVTGTWSNQHQLTFFLPFLLPTEKEKEALQDNESGDQRQDEHMIVELLARNAQQLLEDLPVHSPLCQPIVFRLAHGMST